jgi:hypothetical protein
MNAAKLACIHETITTRFPKVGGHKHTPVPGAVVRRCRVPLHAVYCSSTA